jgi:hypothetical protein
MCNRWAGALLLACLLTHVKAFAQPLVTSGEYLFGPDLSENSACQLAELQARQNALLKVNGQVLSLDESYVCSEKSFGQTGNSVCALNKFLWAQIFGTVKTEKLLDKKVEAITGAKRCTVQLEVLVAPPMQMPAPNFDVTASLSQSQVRVGEKIRIDINPLSPAYLAVFNWLPGLAGGGHLHKLFPNEFQPDAFLTTSLSLPSRDYELLVGEPDSRRDGDKPVGGEPAHIEHFVFLLTKEPYAWPVAMPYAQLSEKLSEIKPQDVRVRKKSIIVLHKD